MGLSADDPRVGRVAFAKLQGEGLEYFIRKYEVLLGRKSKSTELDIVLGKCTMLLVNMPSRQLLDMQPVCRRQHEHFPAACQDCLQFSAW